MVGGLQGEEWKFIQKYLKEKDLVWSWQNKGDFADIQKGLRNHFAAKG